MIFRILIICACILPMLNCSTKVTEGGSGSEAGNPKIVGVVKDTDGPASGVVVTLYPVDFNPVTDAVTETMRAVTDEKGEYQFEIVDAGNYNIQALHPEPRSVALVRGIEVSEPSDANIDVQNADLQEPATLSLHLSELAIQPGGHLYFPGTGISTVISEKDISSGTTRLNSVPAGPYKVLHYSSPDNSESTNILQTELNIQPGESAVQGPYAAWSDTVKIVINTSATGADIKEDLIGFPLLVRLDVGSGVMASAQSDGADLRLSASDGITPLVYEIERWDIENQVAEIWVRVDTVFGNNALQYIMMYSGSADAGSASSGADVFSTAGSFNGVWHLAEDGNTAVDGYADASSNTNHGTGFSLTGQSDVPAAVGVGQVFDGTEDFIDISGGNAAVQDNGSRTLSVWVRKDGGNHNCIMATGSSGVDSTAFNLVLYDGQFIDDTTWMFVGNHAGVMGYFYDFYPENGTDLDDNAWHHIAAVYTEGENLQIFVDGVLDNTAAPLRNNYKTTGQTNFIGKSNDNDPIFEEYLFQGAIDEVRISSEARSADWIKLSFENQKMGSTVVLIED